jgi:hypothetical protein
VALSDYYLGRGLRQIGASLPVDLVVEFDLRIGDGPFRSRSSMMLKLSATSSIVQVPTGTMANLPIIGFPGPLAADLPRRETQTTQYPGC